MTRVWLVECLNQKTGEWNAIGGCEVFKVRGEARAVMKKLARVYGQCNVRGARFRVTEYKSLCELGG